MSMRMMIFSGRSNLPLAQSIARSLRKRQGKISIKSFPDGETWVKFGENIRGAEVYIIQHTGQPDTNLVELLIMIDAAKRAGARKIVLVITYYGYGRQDRKDQPRVAITAKLEADLLTKAGATRVITMDLHAAQIQGFFDIPLDNLFGSKIFTPVVRRLKKKVRGKLAVCSADIGGIKMARNYSKRLGVELLIIDKRRPKQSLSEVMNIIGNPNGKWIIIVDDILDTGGSITKAAAALKKAGAKGVYAIITHPLFSKKAFELIQKSCIKHLWVSDTVPLKQTHPKVSVVKAGNIFAQAILRSHRNKSVSNLFTENKE